MSTATVAEDFERYRLNVDVRDDCMLQLVRDPISGNDTWQTWKRRRNLAQGAFGQVWQEGYEDIYGDWHYRAVKSCSEERMRAAGVDYRRELSALAAFSKSENILVVQKRPEFHRWWVKIADFGISKRVSADADSALHTSIGTRPYCAPEILGHIEQYRETFAYSNKVDMRSFGCVLFNLGSQGQLAFSESDLVRYCDGGLQFNPKSLTVHLNNDGKLLIKALLQVKPNQRPSATEALRHPWLAIPKSPGSYSSSKLPPKSLSNDRQNFNSFLNSTVSTNLPPASNILELAMRPAIPSDPRTPAPSDHTCQNTPTKTSKSHTEELQSPYNAQTSLVTSTRKRTTEKSIGASATDKEAVLESRVGKITSQKPHVNADASRIGSSPSTEEESSRNEDPELTKWLERNDENLRERRKRCEGSLFLAVEQGRLDILKRLNLQHADIVAENKYGASPIHNAAILGQLEVARWLVAQGAGINVKDNEGTSPLHQAAQYGQLEVTTWLVERGADIKALDRYGNSPLNAAAYSGQLEIVKALVKRGADVNIRDNSGWTPLHYAAKYGQLDLVKWLVKQGAVVNAGDVFWQTSECIAVQYGQKKSAAWLRGLEPGQPLSEKVKRLFSRA